MHVKQNNFFFEIVTLIDQLSLPILGTLNSLSFIAIKRKSIKNRSITYFHAVNLETSTKH